MIIWLVVVGVALLALRLALLALSVLLIVSCKTNLPALFLPTRLRYFADGVCGG